ncbi:beach domain protein [Pelomyxa schiedti]|nr:beach domain protein [Pelomyxa schiedti]
MGNPGDLIVGFRDRSAAAITAPFLFYFKKGTRKEARLHRPRVRSHANNQGAYTTPTPTTTTRQQHGHAVDEKTAGGPRWGTGHGSDPLAGGHFVDFAAAAPAAASASASTSTTTSSSCPCASSDDHPRAPAAVVGHRQQRAAARAHNQRERHAGAAEHGRAAPPDAPHALLGPAAAAAAHGAPRPAPRRTSFYCDPVPPVAGPLTLAFLVVNGCVGHRGRRRWHAHNYARAAAGGDHHGGGSGSGRGLWSQFTSAKNDKEKISRLNALLPVFVRLFKDKKLSLSGDLSRSSFGKAQLLELVQAVTHRFVSEVRTWTQPHERNGTKLLQMLGQSGGDFSGVELVQTLEIALTPTVGIEVLKLGTKDELPAFVVRVLLQVLSSAPKLVGDLGPGVESMTKLVDVLAVLCILPETITQLEETETLDLLFVSGAAQCPPYMSILRERVLATVGAIARQHTTPSLIEYMHHKTVVQQQVESLRSVSKFPVSTLVMIGSCIVDYLAQSALFSNALLMDLSSASGYMVLRDMLVHIDALSSGSSETTITTTSNLFVMTVNGEVLLVKDFPEINSNLSTILDVILRLVYVERCQANRTDGKSVRNRDAFTVLQWFFLHCRSESAQLRVLDLITHIYASHPENFLILQELHTITYFLEKMDSMSDLLRHAVLRLLLFVITALNCIPVQELTTASNMLLSSSSLSTVVNLQKFLSILIEHDKKYRDILRDCGLLEDCLRVLGFSAAQQNIGTSTVSQQHPLPTRKVLSAVSLEHCSIVLQVLSSLLSDSEKNISVLCEVTNIMDSLVTFIKFPITRPGALMVFYQMIAQDFDQLRKDLSHIVSLLHKCTPRTDVALMLDLLHFMCDLFVEYPKTKDTFREGNGCLVLQQILSVMDGVFQADQALTLSGDAINLLESILNSFTAVMQQNHVNRASFHEFSTNQLVTSIVQSGVLSSTYALRVFQCLFDMATETYPPITVIKLEEDSIDFSRPLEIRISEAIVTILSLIKMCATEIQQAVLHKLCHFATTAVNQFAMCSIGALQTLLETFPQSFVAPSDPLNKLLLLLGERLSSFRVTPYELRLLFRMIVPTVDSTHYSGSGDTITCLHLLSMLKRASHKSQPVPSVFFDTNHVPCAGIHIPSLGVHSWPPEKNYTLMFWIYLESTGSSDSIPINVITFYSDDGKPLLQLSLNNGAQLSISVLKPVPVATLERHRWHHIVFVHSKSILKGTTAKVYVDGEQHWNGKIAYPVICTSSVDEHVYATIGNVISQNIREGRRENHVWQLGPLYLLSEMLSPAAVLACYTLGPCYCHSFQGDLSIYQTHEIINTHNLHTLSTMNSSTDSGPTVVSELGQLDLGTVEFGSMHIDFALSGSNITFTSDGRNYICSSSDLNGSCTRIQENELECHGGCTALLPNTVPQCLQSVGGLSVLFALLEKSQNKIELQELMEFIVLTVLWNPFNTAEMESIHGYETLTNILKQKADLMSIEIHSFLLQLAGINPEDDNCVLSNSHVLKYIYFDFELWKQVGADLQQRVISDMMTLLAPTNIYAKFNANRFCALSAVQNLLHILRDEQIPVEVIMCVIDLLYQMLLTVTRLEDLKIVSAFLISSLSIHKAEFRRYSPSQPLDTSPLTITTQFLGRQVKIENRLLQMIFDLLLNTADKTAVFELVSPPWLFHFIGADLPASTVNLALKILGTQLQLKGKFSTNFAHIDGFALLLRNLEPFYACTEIYFTLLSIVLGKPLVELKKDAYEYVDLFPLFKQSDLRVVCVEMLPVVLGMLRFSFTKSLSISKPVAVVASPVTPLRATLATPIPIPGEAFPKVPNLGSPRGSAFRQRSISAAPLPRSSPSTPSSSWLDMAVPSNSPLTSNTPPTSPRQTSPSDSPTQRRNSAAVLPSANPTPSPLATSNGPYLPDMQHMQQTLIKFLTYLFDNCPSFSEACTEPHTTQALVGVLFPKPAGITTEEIPNISPVQLQQSITVVRELKPGDPCGLMYSLLFQLVMVSLKGASKGVHLLIQVLESAPPAVWEKEQYNLFMNRLLIGVFEAVESTASKKEFTENSRVSNNISQLCVFSVEKVIQGIVNPKQVLQFFLHLLDRIGEANENPTSLLSKSSGPKPDLAAIFKSLNRLIINMLGTQKQQQESLSNYVMKRIFNNVKTILSPNNTDNDFFLTLMYVTNHFLYDEDPELVECTFSLWKHLLHSRRHLIDPILVVKVSNNETVNLKPGGFDLLEQRDLSKFATWIQANRHLVTQMVEDSLRKYWQNWDQNETRVKQDQYNKFREAQSTKLKQFERMQREANKHQHLLLTEGLKAANEIKNKELERLQQHRRIYADKHHFVCGLWNTQSEQLRTERAVWGSNIPDPYAKWKIDETEGPYRMRKKLEHDHTFYERYPYIPESDKEFARNSIPPPMSTDSKKWHSLNKPKNPIKVSAEIKHKPLLDSKEDAGGKLHLKERASPISFTVNISASGLNSSSLLPSQPLSPRPCVSPQNGTSPTTPNSTTSPVNNGLPGTSPNPSSGTQFEITGDGDLPTVTSALTTLSEEEKLEVDEFYDISAEAVKSIDDEEQKDQKVMRLLDQGDTILNKYKCSAVQGMGKHEGIFVISETHLYVIFGFTLSPTNEIIDAIYQPTQSRLLVMSSSSLSPTTVVAPATVRVEKWAKEDITAVFLRRYTLQPVAIEIFSSDGQNDLIVFEAKDIDVVFKTCQKICEESTSSVGGLVSVLGVRNALGASSSTEAIEAQAKTMTIRGQGLLKVGLQEQVTQLWVDGKISNFQYLMEVNTFAGRSYNDLTQYPVFPWILADYESENLDLSSPSSFRDLSKPMGAQTEPRASKIRENFESFDEVSEPPFHYGSHYSSPGAVVYYMLRAEPFTTHFLVLQDGRWDHPDRLFHSVSDVWQINSSKTQYMELIPEFFYFPEFLLNDNRFNLGIKQNQEQVGNVVLPPWARNCPRQFTRKHLQALESPYVSEHLHEWIDLIFGYKQRGKAAELALNLFCSISYEGAVNIDAIKDPLQKKAAIDRINNFGQTPKQIWTERHPKRRLEAIPGTPILCSNPGKMTSSYLVSITKDLSDPCAVHQIRFYNDKVHAVGKNKILLPPSFHRTFSWSHLDHTIRTSSENKFTSIVDCPHSNSVHVTCACAPDDGKCIALGADDSTIRVLALHSGGVLGKCASVQAILRGHYSAVTCLAASRAQSVLVSGAKDDICIVWDLNRLIYVRQLAHGETPVCMDIHDLTGDIATCSSTLIRLWTINGDDLASHRLSAPGDSILCCALYKGLEGMMSHDAVLLTGHKDGIKVWYFDSPGAINITSATTVTTTPTITPTPSTTGRLARLSVTHAVTLSTGYTSPVTSLYITGSQCYSSRVSVYTGDASGAVHVFNDPDAVVSKPQRSRGSSYSFRLPIRPSLAQALEALPPSLGPPTPSSTSTSSLNSNMNSSGGSSHH